MYSAAPSDSSRPVTVFIDRPMRRSCGSTVMTSAFTVSPSLTTDRGSSTRSVFISETWIRPSTPASSSTKAPKSMTLMTFTERMRPGG